MKNTFYRCVLLTPLENVSRLLHGCLFVDAIGLCVCVVFFSTITFIMS